MIAALNDLGLTFLVGALTLVGIEAIAWYLFNKPLTGFFRGRLGLHSTKPAQDSTESSDLAVWVFVVSSFVVGICVEDVSYALRDPGDLPPRVTRYVWSADHIRRDVLVGNYSFAQKRLGRELAERHAFMRLAPSDSTAKLETWMLSRTSVPPADTGALDCLAAKLYYHAKNTVFLQPPYFSELEHIQDRIDFTRTILLVSAFLWVATLLALLGVLAWKLFVLWPHQPAERLGSASLVMFAFTVIACVSGYAFHFESREYNKRVYGYYSTSLVYPDGSAKISAADSARAAAVRAPGTQPPPTDTTPRPDTCVPAP